MKKDKFEITPAAIKAGAQVLRDSIVTKDEYDMPHLHDASGDPGKDEVANVVRAVLIAASLVGGS